MYGSSYCAWRFACCTLRQQQHQRPIWLLTLTTCCQVDECSGSLISSLLNPPTDCATAKLERIITAVDLPAEDISHYAQTDLAGDAELESGAASEAEFDLPPLDDAALDGLGGVAEIVRLYQGAASEEERSGLFCIMLEHAFVRLVQVPSSCAEAILLLLCMVWEAMFRFTDTVQCPLQLSDGATLA